MCWTSLVEWFLRRRILARPPLFQMADSGHVKTGADVTLSRSHDFNSGSQTGGDNAAGTKHYKFSSASIRAV